MAIVKGVGNVGQGLFSGMSSYRGPVQTGATKTSLAQNFASKGFTMPGGLVDKPSQDAYMKGKLATLGGYSTVDQARMASARAAKASYEARNMPVPQQVLDTLAGNYGKDHAGETMTAPPLNPQGQPWSKPQGYAPSYQNLRLAAAQDVLTGQPNGGAPDWAREAAAARAPGSVSPAPAPAPSLGGVDPQRFENDPTYRAEVLRAQEQMRLAGTAAGSRTYRDDVTSAASRLSYGTQRAPEMQTLFDRLRAESLSAQLLRRNSKV